jgi:hypothetical protein
MEGFQGQLINVLNMTRYRQASQPQDKVYALYGVLASLDINLQPLVENTPFEEVYLDFTKRIINWRGSLDILREAGVSPAAGESRLQNTPSWVPDWDGPLIASHCVDAKPHKILLQTSAFQNPDWKS